MGDFMDSRMSSGLFPALGYLGAGYLQARAAKRTAEAQERTAAAQLDYTKQRDAIEDARYAAGQAATDRQSAEMAKGFKGGFGLPMTEKKKEKDKVPYGQQLGLASAAAWGTPHNGGGAINGLANTLGSYYGKDKKATGVGGLYSGTPAVAG